MTNRPSLLERIRFAASPEARKNQKGLALLDVLLGMAIFALIVVIAIQAIAAFRQSAYLTGAKSDAKQVAVGIESQLTDDPTFAPSSSTVPSGLDSVNMTTGDTVTKFNYDTTTSNYTFCVVHTSSSSVDAWAYYDSAQGAIVDAGKGAPTGNCA